MFKGLKKLIGNVDKPNSPDALSQNRPSSSDLNYTITILNSDFSTTSSLSSEMEDSRFCIYDDIIEIPTNSPARVTVGKSTTVDLDKLSQFPSSLIDTESASEVGNSCVVSEYANEIKKENVYVAYKELYDRYQKQIEITNILKETLMIHDKEKVNITKAQDKFLQRIAELKEQYTLEQAAKAHLEDLLRNYVEEKEYIISALNIKVDVLSKIVNSDECKSTQPVDSIDLLDKCERLNEELSSTRIECASLENQIELLKKSEESALLSLVENKIAIHKELETKEDEIAKLEMTISGLRMENKLFFKELADHSSIKSYKVNIGQNVQEEMSLAFEFKENEVKELRNRVKVLEQHSESLKKTNISIEEGSKAKEKEIKDLKLVISRLERTLYDDKVSYSKKIDMLLNGIEEKSQIIKNLTNQLKEMDIQKQNNQKSENELIDLQTEIPQQNYPKERINELHYKLREIEFTIEKNEKKYREQQNNIDEIYLKNKSLVKSEKELELKINDYKISNEKLQETIKLLQNENESVVKTIKMNIDENQLTFDKSNEFRKKTFSELNQEKSNKISEERCIESVIKDYNFLTEGNAYLKNERMLQTFQDMIKKIKIYCENDKSFVIDQLTEWSLIFNEYIKQLNAEYSSQTKLYNNNLIETKRKLESIQKAYFSLKSNCIQSLEYFKIEIIEKHNKVIMNNISQNSKEHERKNIELLRLNDEIGYYKKSEKSIKAEVKETVQERQDCIEIKKKSLIDLKNEYSNYQVAHEKIIQYVESTSQREQCLQRQITKLNEELSELRKLYKNEVHNNHKNLDKDDDDKIACEMKYLRNVLYEYMTGKQPMVLAKVLATLVKFDSNQLNTVLQKEKQKMSLSKTFRLWF